MVINIIVDSRKPEDIERLIWEFSAQGLHERDYEFWPATVNKDSVVSSINASHKKIVRWAKEINLPFVVIGEQDLHFTGLGAWDYFIKSVPETYDLFLACTYIVPISNNKICGFHLYIVNSKYYDTFLSVPDNVHIDTYQDEMKGDFKFCYPFPAIQRAGWSFNNKAIVDYNKVLRPEDIWNGNLL